MAHSRPSPGQSCPLQLSPAHPIQSESKPLWPSPPQHLQSKPSPGHSCSVLVQSASSPDPVQASPAQSSVSLAQSQLSPAQYRLSPGPVSIVMVLIGISGFLCDYWRGFGGCHNWGRSGPVPAQPMPSPIFIQSWPRSGQPRSIGRPGRPKPSAGPIQAQSRPLPDTPHAIPCFTTIPRTPNVITAPSQ